LDRRAAIILADGSEGLDTITPLNDTFHEIKSELNIKFPLGESEASILFADIQSHLTGIYQAEKEALTALQAAVAKLE